MIVLDRTRLIDHLNFLTIIICNQRVSFLFLGIPNMVVRTLVRSNLVRRGDIYYFRYTLPDHIHGLCSNLPTEIKRSFHANIYTVASSFGMYKTPIKLNVLVTANIANCFMSTLKPIVETEQPQLNNKIEASNNRIT